ncbi:MAG: hypothetical protein AAF719_03240 [Pseudomonadota bacterium]
MARRREKGPMFWRVAIATMLVGVFALFAFIAFNRPPPLEIATGCRQDKRDPAHTVMLIDQSDPFNTRDFGWVEGFMESEARRLPKYGRLTVVTPSTQNPFDPPDVFVMCSPGSADKANPILENPRMIDDNWREGFFSPLKTAMDGVLADKSASNSPLFEAVYAIGDRADFQSSVDNRRLIIVSDLMQHSDAFSLYRSKTDWDAYQSSTLSSQTPQLFGVDVVARIVPRQRYDLPLDDLKAFWSQYFNGTGAAFRPVN